MDHRRKINKIQMPSPMTSKRSKLPCIMVTDAPFVKDKPILEDHRLINWKTWLKRHKKQYQALDEGDSQPAREMVMNSCEKIRSQIEMKDLMECATIPVIPDKYHGNPGFWKVPPLLKNHENSSSSEIGPVLTKKELNLLPTLEYVEVPMCIRQEKNLVNPSPKVPAWKRNSYLITRKHELADNIAIIQPSIPKMVNLMALGQGFGRKEKDVAHVPLISIFDTSLGNADTETNIRESSGDSGVTVALKINDLEIRKNDELTCDSFNSDPDELTWILNFSGELNEKSEKCLYLENKGSVAIVYQWRNTPFASKTVSVTSRCSANFFFNKNKALILPGQKVKFPVWFQTRQSGIFSESWLMVTDPIVSRRAIVIRMWGYVESEVSYLTEREVDTYLDRCIRNTTVREIIEEIFHNGTSYSGLPDPAYKSLYLERELFCAKNPSYYYHARLVARLYHLYAAHSLPDASPWTLSLIDLRHILLQIKNPDLRHESLKIFSDLCQQCLEPCLFSSVRNMKYAVVYNVLCAMVNKVEEESEFVKRNCVLRGKDNRSSMESGIMTVQEHRASNVSDSRATPAKDPVTQSSKIKHSSKTITSSRNSSLTMLDMKSSSLILSHTEIVLYREVFYVRIYQLLAEAIEQACAAIDSLNYLNELES